MAWLFVLLIGLADICAFAAACLDGWNAGDEPPPSRAVVAMSTAAWVCFGGALVVAGVWLMEAIRAGGF